MLRRSKTLAYFLVILAIYTLCLRSNIAQTERRRPMKHTAILKGELSYPSEGIPPEMIVCAENLKTGDTYCTSKQIESRTYATGFGYELEVPAGSYFVFATFPHDSEEYKAMPPEARGYRAYYSEYVRCMNARERRNPDVECPSHTPIRVTLRAGQIASRIDPGDWYNH
jgi:hypothetical protein